MTTFQQKARKQLLPEERRVLLARYIQEKNQQVERAFLKEQELADDNLFASRKISTTKIYLDSICPAANTTNTSKRAYGPEQTGANAFDSHELIQQIAEIAQFSADIKIQQEKHLEEIIKLQSSIKMNTTEVRKVEDELSDNETSQRIRYSMFMEHLKEITGSMEILESKIQLLNESTTLRLERIERLELSDASKTQRISASANIAGTSSNTYFGAKATFPVSYSNTGSPPMLKAMELSPGIVMTDVGITETTQRTEIGTDEIPGIVITSPSDCSEEMYDLAMEIFSRNVDQQLGEDQEKIKQNCENSEGT